MEPNQIKPGDKVSKGHIVYTVVTEPAEDIFQATDEEGQTVSMSTHEVLTVHCADDDSAR